MYTEIVSAMQSAKALGELLKAAQSLSNYNELAAAVSEVSTKLMDATAVALSSQEKQSRLATRIQELEAALQKAEDWEEQVKRYELIEFAATGALAYRLRLGMEAGQPVHYLCVGCVDKRQISKLQPLGNRRFLHCHTCNTRIQIELVPTSNVVGSAPRGRSSWMEW